MLYILLKSLKGKKIIFPCVKTYIIIRKKNNFFPDLFVKMSFLIKGDIERLTDSSDTKKIMNLLVHTKWGTIELFKELLEKILDNNFYKIYLELLTYIEYSTSDTSNIPKNSLKDTMSKILFSKETSKIEEVSEYVLKNGSENQKFLFLQLAKENNNKTVLDMFNPGPGPGNPPSKLDSDEDEEPESDSEEEEEDYYYPESESDNEDITLSECEYFSLNSNKNPNTKKNFKTLDEFIEYKTKCNPGPGPGNIDVDAPYYLCNSSSLINSPTVCGYSKTSDNLFTSKKDDFIICSETSESFKKETKNGDYFEISTNCTTSMTNNWKEINEWMKAQKKYMDSLSFDERTSLLDYNGASGNDPQSFHWNNVLRGLEKIDSSAAYNTIDSITLFYRLILNAPRTPNMLVFRGDNVNINDNYLRKKKLENKAFISTSLDLNVATNYAGGNEDSDTNYDDEGNVIRSEKEAVSQIQIPYGTPAIFIAGVNYPDVDERFEIVLLPNIFKYEGYYEKYNTELNKNIIGNPDPGTGKNTRHPFFYCWKYEMTLPLVDLLHYCIETPLKPTNEEVLASFINYFNRFWKYQSSDDQLLWITKGGYGYNLLLEHKYSIKNLIPTHDLDLGAYYDINKTTEEEVSSVINKTKEEIKKWIESLPSNVQDSIVIDGRSDDNLEIIFIKYTYCDDIEEGLIDISFIGIEGGFPYELIDEELSKKVKLPIKTEIGYLEELKGLFFRENILGLDERTYNVRNMFSGITTSKGIKTIKRISNLCEQMIDYDTPLIDNRGRTVYDYGKLCGLFVDLSLNGLHILGEEEMSKLSERLKDDKPIASFYLKTQIYKLIQEKRDKEKVKQFLIKNPNWLWKQSEEIIDKVEEFLIDDSEDTKIWFIEPLKKRLLKDIKFVNSLDKRKFNKIIDILRYNFKDINFIKEWIKLIVKKDKEWFWSIDESSRINIIDVFTYYDEGRDPKTDENNKNNDFEWISKLLEKRLKDKNDLFLLVSIDSLNRFSKEKWYIEYLNNLFNTDFDKLMTLSRYTLIDLFLEKIKKEMSSNPLWYFSKSDRIQGKIMELFTYSDNKDKDWFVNWMENIKKDSRYKTYFDYMSYSLKQMYKNNFDFMSYYLQERYTKN